MSEGNLPLESDGQASNSSGYCQNFCQKRCILFRLFNFAARVNMGKGQEVIFQASSVVKVGVGKAWDSVSPYAKTALHWGFIPAIIVVGMTCTDPKPTLAQLVGPM